MTAFTGQEIGEFEKFAKDLSERVSGYAQEQNSDRYNWLLSDWYSAWDDRTKVRCALWLLSKIEFPSDDTRQKLQFLYEEEYCTCYCTAYATFENDIAVPEAEAIALCHEFPRHFLLFDTVGVRLFVERVVKTRSEALKPALNGFMEAVETAQIDFEKYRAKTRKRTIKILKKHLDTGNTSGNGFIRRCRSLFPTFR